MCAWYSVSFCSLTCCLDRLHVTVGISQDSSFRVQESLAHLTLRPLGKARGRLEGCQPTCPPPHSLPPSSVPAPTFGRPSRFDDGLAHPSVKRKRPSGHSIYKVVYHATFLVANTCFWQPSILSFFPVLASESPGPPTPRISLPHYSASVIQIIPGRCDRQFVACQVHQTNQD